MGLPRGAADGDDLALRPGLTRSGAGVVNVSFEQRCFAVATFPRRTVAEFPTATSEKQVFGALETRILQRTRYTGSQRFLHNSPLARDAKSA